MEPAALARFSDMITSDSLLFGFFSLMDGQMIPLATMRSTRRAFS